MYMGSHAVQRMHVVKQPAGTGQEQVSGRCMECKPVEGARPGRLWVSSQHWGSVPCGFTNLTPST